jgi:hypothetical protein
MDRPYGVDDVSKDHAVRVFGAHVLELGFAPVRAQHPRRRSSGTGPSLDVVVNGSRSCWWGDGRHDCWYNTGAWACFFF